MGIAQLLGSCLLSLVEAKLLLGQALLAAQNFLGNLGPNFCLLQRRIYSKPCKPKPYPVSLRPTERAPAGCESVQLCVR